jgi:hypothetical protein
VIAVRNDADLGARLTAAIADRRAEEHVVAVMAEDDRADASRCAEVSRAAAPNASEGGLTVGAKNLYELIANAPGMTW